MEEDYIIATNSDTGEKCIITYLDTIDEPVLLVYDEDNSIKEGHIITGIKLSKESSMTPDEISEITFNAPDYREIFGEETLKRIEEDAAKLTENFTKFTKK